MLPAAKNPPASLFSSNVAPETNTSHNQRELEPKAVPLCLSSAPAVNYMEPITFTFILKA